MMTRFFLPLIVWLMLPALCAPMAAWGQGDNAGSGEAKKTVFTHRWEMGLTLHTRGMGGHIERGAYRGVVMIRYGQGAFFLAPTPEAASGKVDGLVV